MDSDEWGKLDRTTSQLHLIAAKTTAINTLDTFVASLEQIRPIDFTNDQLVGEKIQEVGALHFAAAAHTGQVLSPSLSVVHTGVSASASASTIHPPTHPSIHPSIHPSTHPSSQPVGHKRARVGGPD